jgi:hypothetical protein
VIATAYRVADGCNCHSRELDLLAAIDRFGGQAVMGRPLGAGEIKRMIVAEQVVEAYRGRERADNWAAWADANPYYAALLARAAKAAEME